MNALLKQLLLGGSATALIAGASFTGAFAQDNSSDNSTDIETVTSSASRIDLKGFEAPTPVTVVGIDQLNRDAQVDLGDELRQLPQIRGGNSITTNANSGCISQGDSAIDTVALRNLGAQRNLVLFDRQRIVTSSYQEGTVDISTIPSAMIQRVDVVTGGASAAWGSDAVTGVVNLVINKTFEGFKGSATFEDYTEVSSPTYKGEAAWGTSFLDGKGHTEMAVDVTLENTPVFQGQMWDSHPPNGRSSIYNPAYCNAVGYAKGLTTSGSCTSINAGQPIFSYQFGTASDTAVQGGLINTNTAGTAGSGLAANGLKGVMFVGPAATPTQFQYGSLYGSGGATCYNGCTNNPEGTGGFTYLATPYHSATYFNYTSYQITPDIRASIQLNYSRLSEVSLGNTQSGANKVIYADNPYLPSSVAQQFVCNPGVTSATCAAGTTTLSNGYNPFTMQNTPSAFATPLTLAQMQARPTQTATMGFVFTGNGITTGPTAISANEQIPYTNNNLCIQVYEPCDYFNKVLMRGVFTLDGSLGDDWSWTAYIQHSEFRGKQNVANDDISNRFSDALDAVRVTSGNVGSSGLPVGSIQCRALLSAANLTAYAAAPSTIGALYGITAASELQGCQPYDPFGYNNVSQAAANYIAPGIMGFQDMDGAVTNSELIRTQQESGAVELNGVLPWQLPAGEIGVAFGGEWRLEREGTYNATPYSLIGAYSSGNFVDFEGRLHTEEGYAEVDVPLLKDFIVQNVNFNAAGRVTDYSFSGLVETWKLGLTSQLTDDFRLRMTWSYDIRAPDIFDLYAPSALAERSCPSFIVGPGGSNGGLANNCYSVAGGNPNLQPEKANTIAAGIVMTPHWVDGLTASIDWYQIHLHGALYTAQYTDVETRCQSGQLTYCPLIVFDNGLPYPAGTVSQIDYIYTIPVNAALYTTAGYDFAVNYGFDLFSGQVDMSLNGNYTYDFAEALNQIYYQGAGASGGYYGGGARIHANLNMNYRQGPWSFGYQVRFTGPSVMDFGTEGQPLLSYIGITYNQVNGVNVATSTTGNDYYFGERSTNTTAAAAAVDLRASYKWDNNITLFGAIDNVGDNPSIDFSQLRRAYRVGIRFNY